MSAKRIHRAVAPHVAALLLLAACGGTGSGADGDPGPPSSDLRVLSVNVSPGAVWQINRPIDVVFSSDVDFASVGPSAIQIATLLGVPAVGTFTLHSPRTVRWQPRCPTDAGDDSGLRPGEAYRLVIPSGALAVRDTAGGALESALTVPFQTPASNDPQLLFVDPVPGPPSALVRGFAGVPLDAEAATYVEVGAGPREYVTYDPALQEGRITSLVPLNLYSRADSRVAVVVQLDQPVDPAPSNLSSDRVRIEYQLGAGGPWRPLPTDVTLIDNCTEVGAALRVAPRGLLPEGSELRVVLRAGLRDLTGDALQSDVTDLVRLTSVSESTPGAIVGADEILEEFSFGGGGPDSLEDLTAVTPSPRGGWGGGVLAPSFDFGGTGGPGGNFDVVVRTGQTVILDTSADQIRGGPGGVETTTQTLINGVLDVRNLTVERGATLLFTGPNTARILASGAVRVHGVVSVNGGDNPGVTTLNTTNQPEPGAIGNAGGGRGGTASYLTSQSTPRGASGDGAFGRGGVGGEGGETSYSTAGKNARRGAGGGGGTLASSPVRYDVVDPMSPGTVLVPDAICQTLIGFDGEPGFPGGRNGLGAVTQSARAAGGARGPAPFFDSSAANDFFGTLRTAPRLDPLTQAVIEPSRIVIGELTRAWAGAGGGAGGDASSTATFPISPFNPLGDEKGGGGGGGAGGIEILALGEIYVGRADPSDPTEIGGRITADGGHGGAGENTGHFDRVGGAGGGGSGGHIVLSSANRIRIDSEAPEGAGFNQAQAFYTDAPTVTRHPRRPISALGGQGGAGQENRCGARTGGELEWGIDAIPPGAFEGSTLVPPLGTPGVSAFLGCNVGSPNDPEGTTPGAGGDGGPGLIQLHASNPDAQLLFPRRSGTYGTGIDVTFSCAPPPVGWRRPTEAPDVLVPFFGDESESLSKWIPLGEARRAADGTAERVAFAFGGTDLTAPDFADRGVVERDGTRVRELSPILGYEPVASEPTGPGGATYVTGGDTLHFPSAGVDALYLDNSALVRGFTVRVRGASSAGAPLDFPVLDAEFVESEARLLCVVDPLGNALGAALTSFGADAEAALVPNFFRVVTAGVLDAYPANTSIRITFDATVVDRLTGLPDDSRAFSRTVSPVAGEATPDIAELLQAALPAAPFGQAPYEGWDFVRFRVEFDLDVSGNQGVNPAAPRPALDLIRVPFRF